MFSKDTPPLSKDQPLYICGSSRQLHVCSLLRNHRSCCRKYLTGRVPKKGCRTLFSTTVRHAHSCHWCSGLFPAGEAADRFLSEISLGIWICLAPPAHPQVCNVPVYVGGKTDSGCRPSCTEHSACILNFFSPPRMQTHIVLGLR